MPAQPEEKRMNNEQDPFAAGETIPSQISAPSTNHGLSDPDEFLSGGIVSAKFDAIGTVHQGTIMDYVVQQQRDIRTHEPKFWQDGQPCEQMVITIQTDERDQSIDDDNGQRRLYINRPSGMYTALTKAIKISGGKFAVGGTVAFKYTSNGTPTQKGYNPPKNYVAKYTPPGGVVQQPDAPQQPASDADLQNAKVNAYRSFCAIYPGKPKPEIDELWKAAVKAYSAAAPQSWTTAQWLAFVGDTFTKPTVPNPIPDSGGVPLNDIPF